MRYGIGLAVSAVLVSAILFGAYKAGHWRGGRDKGLTGVAVLDMDELAKRLGVDAAIEKQVKDAQTSLDQQLQSLQASLREQYQQKSQEMKSQQTKTGPAPDQAAAKQQLAELEQKLNLQLAQAQQTARKKFDVFRLGLIQNFRGEVTPVAREVAAQHGLGVVITKNDTVLLTFDEAHDITDAVAAKLREKLATAGNQATGAPEASATAQADRPASNVR